MIVQSIGLVLMTSFMFTLSAFAKTWRDDFEDGDFNGWKMHTLDWQAGFRTFYANNFGNVPTSTRGVTWYPDK